VVSVRDEYDVAGDDLGADVDLAAGPRPVHALVGRAVPGHLEVVDLLEL
jgi:hypothetical protein